VVREIRKSMAYRERSSFGNLGWIEWEMNVKWKWKEKKRGCFGNFP
jgi:hypothetical protein